MWWTHIFHLLISIFSSQNGADSQPRYIIFYTSNFLSLRKSQYSTVAGRDSTYFCLFTLQRACDTIFNQFHSHFIYPYRNKCSLTTPSLPGIIAHWYILHTNLFMRKKASTHLVNEDSFFLHHQHFSIHLFGNDI